jgi:hypothetical protein
MSITDFIAQAHPLTLDFIENVMMEKLLEVDKYQKAVCLVQELKEETNALV